MNKYEWEKSDADKIKEASRMIDEMLELIDKVKLENVSAGITYRKSPTA